MLFPLGKLSRSRLEGVYPDLVRVVDRAIQDHKPGLPGPGGLRTHEHQAELIARGASRTMNSRHLTGQAVDPVSRGGGEVSWEWEATFRSPPRCRPRRMSSRRCAGAASGILSWRSRLPKTASPTTSRPDGQPAGSRFGRPALRAVEGLSA
jgi:hypothetical protein